MNRLVLTLALLGLSSRGGFCQGTSAARPQSQTSASKRPVSIADMIGMTKIAGDDEWSAGTVRPAVFSHDGKRFAIVVQRGDLEHNTLVSSLIVFRTAQVFASPRPDTILTFASSSNRAAMTGPRWLPGDTALVFLGERPREEAQLYRVSLATRKARALTASPTSISEYNLSENGARLLYVAPRPADSARNEERAAHGFVVTQRIRDLLNGNWDTPPNQDEPQDVFTMPARGGARVRVTGSVISDCYGTPNLSPNGHWAVMQCRATTVPPYWRDYLDGMRGWVAIPASVVVDLERGTAERLLDVPNDRATFTWASGGAAIIATNTLVPFEGADSAERASRRTLRATLTIDPATRAFTVLHGSDSLRVARRDSASGGGMSDRPDILVEEDLNTPPRVVAVNAAGKRAVVFDPNPQFAGLAFGREELFRWRTADGEWLGGLYYPVGHEQGKRYPLVIQTHGFSPDKFQIEGYAPTGYAGQALAGHGIAVLQIGIPPRPASRKAQSTGEEGPFNVRGMEAAIDSLDKQGLIDRNKIALQGWSRTTYYVRHMLTHSRYPVAAAAISDGVDYGYVRYIIEDSLGKVDAETINGGVPIGEALRTWQDRVPTMEADRITAPLRIESIAYPAGGGPLTQWELYSLLKRLGKPVELVYYPRADHILAKPWERMTSQGGNFDWFRFWLTGEEDPDPSKAAQYERWRAMKQTTRPQVMPDDLLHQ